MATATKAVTQHSELSGIEWLALSCLGREAGKHRAEVEPGFRQEIDLLLRIKGHVDVSEDGTTTQTKKPNAEDVLAFLLAVLDPQAKASVVASLKTAGATKVVGPVDEVHKSLAGDLLEPFIQRTFDVPKRGPTKGSFQIGVVEEKKIASAIKATIHTATRAFTLEDV